MKLGFVLAETVNERVLAVQVADLVATVVREAKVSDAQAGQRSGTSATTRAAACDQDLQLADPLLNRGRNEVTVSMSELLVIKIRITGAEEFLVFGQYSFQNKAHIELSSAPRSFLKEYMQAVIGLTDDLPCFSMENYSYMNNLKQIESSRIGSLQYRRFSGDSPRLGRTTHFGIVDPAVTGFVPERFLYLFHAGNGDDRQAVAEGLIAELQTSLGETLAQLNVRIVLPFIGTSFLHDFAGDPSRAIDTQFRLEVMPTAERDAKQVRARYAYGLSMGGFAALSVFFRRPEDFAGVAAQMPALFTFDYTQDAEVSAFVTRTGIPAESIGFLLSLLKPEFAGIMDYRASDPLVLSQSVRTEALQGKRIAFEVGTADSFGCFEGATALHEILNQRQLTHHYELVPGGTHDATFVLSRISGLLKRLF
jgi:hypothetical protein